MMVSFLLVRKCVRSFRTLHESTLKLRISGLIDVLFRYSRLSCSNLIFSPQNLHYYFAKSCLQLCAISRLRSKDERLLIPRLEFYASKTSLKRFRRALRYENVVFFLNIQLTTNPTNFLYWQVCTDPTSKTTYTCRFGIVAVIFHFVSSSSSLLPEGFHAKIVFRRAQI